MIRRLAVIAVVSMLSACGSVEPSIGAPSAGQLSTPTATSSAVPATATPVEPSQSSNPTIQPSATSDPVERTFKEGDVVEVLAGGLAVRGGPGTAYSLLNAARWGADGTQVLGSPYRLAGQEQLVVGLGPLAIDGRDWYQVSHTDDEIHWTHPDDPYGFGIQGWIAATEGEAMFVRLVAEASDPCCFVDTGVGPATTATVPSLPGAGMRGITLTVGHADPAGSCPVRVTDDTGEVLLDEVIVGWGNPGAWWPGEGGQLEIGTECSWSLSVGISVG